jgi:peptidoglycan/LPS O-acetylase OafA/YrhL
MVDQFFVISGFVICFIYQGRIGSGGDYGMFIQRRIGRIVPLHLASFAVTGALIAGAILAGLSINTDFDLSPSCTLSTAALAHSLFGCAGPPINFQNWSVSAEMVVYFLFPLLAVLGKRALLAGLAGGMALALVHDGAPSGFGSAHPVARAVASFLLGVGLYSARDKLKRLPFPRTVLWGSAALFIGALWADLHLAITLTAAYLLVAAAAANDTQAVRSALVTRIAPGAQLTYSIYMVHTTIIAVLMGGIGAKMLTLSRASMALLGLLTYAVVLAIAYLSFVYFEVPARRRINRLPLFKKRSLKIT